MSRSADLLLLFNHKTQVEVHMAESRRGAQQVQKELGKEPGSEAAQRETQHVTEVGHEGIRQATAASKAAADGALRSGAAIAESAQEITAAWARYAEEVMRHTSEASQALLRARTFNEMLEVQANLLRDNMQAFLEQSARIAEAASRMATRPFEGLKEASAQPTRR
jgi:hypothetical protein